MRSTPPTSAEASLALLDRARRGDQEAWQILFEDCYPKIVRVVRKRLSRPMRKIYDSTDIANEVMKSLAAKFDHFNFSSVDGLRAFLIRVQKTVDVITVVRRWHNCGPPDSRQIQFRVLAARDARVLS